MTRRLAALAALVVVAGGVAAAVILASRSSPTSLLQAVARTPRRRPRQERAARLRVPHDRPVPILMYHVLAREPTGAAFPKLFVPPAELAAQVDWLVAHSYHAVTLTQVFAYWGDRGRLPAKPIVLTFDDGYLSDYAVALPTLRSHRWPGMLDLAVRNLAPGDLEPWQVRQMVAAGWEIAAHTISHVDLTTLGPARLRDEVAGSRAELRRLFHQPVRFFSYPLGHYDDRVVAAVKAAGYVGATTERKGLARPGEPFTLPRIAIVPGDGAGGLAEKLRRALEPRGAPRSAVRRQPGLHNEGASASGYRSKAGSSYG
jgi:peptidoglycan/xylan/chitin deacetylase (PgdA/CDA1 family)